MSTKLKSSRADISLTRLKGADDETYIKVNMFQNRRYSVIGINNIDEIISLTREQAGALAHDLMAFSIKWEEEA